MPILGPEHDLQHPVEGDSAWSESYYFNAYDPDADVGFYTRCGIRPNEGHVDIGMSVWLPGQEIGHIGGRRELTTMIDRVLDVAGIRYELIEPMQTWRLAGSGEAKVYDLKTRKPRTANVQFDVRFNNDAVLHQRGAALADSRFIQPLNQCPRPAADCGLQREAGRQRPNGCPTESERTLRRGPGSHSRRLCRAIRRFRYRRRLRPLSAP